MNSRELENSQPYQTRPNNDAVYPYTVEGQTRLAQDAAATVLALTRANAEAVEEMAAAMARGDRAGALRAMTGHRVGLLNAARERLDSALRWLEHSQG